MTSKKVTSCSKRGFRKRGPGRKICQRLKHENDDKWKLLTKDVTLWVHELSGPYWRDRPGRKEKKKIQRCVYTNPKNRIVNCRRTVRKKKHRTHSLESQTNSILVYGMNISHTPRSCISINALVKLTEGVMLINKKMFVILGPVQDH